LTGLVGRAGGVVGQDVDQRAGRAVLGHRGGVGVGFGGDAYGVQRRVDRVCRVLVVVDTVGLAVVPDGVGEAVRAVVVGVGRDVAYLARLDGHRAARLFPYATLFRSLTGLVGRAGGVVGQDVDQRAGRAVLGHRGGVGV